MALLVVAIHSEAVNDYHPLYEITWPIINSAVPVFFTISSFLLFNKLRQPGIAAHETMKLLKHFTWRIFLLYVFWMVAQTPLVLHARGYLDYDLCLIPFAMIKDVTLCSTFHGSWFLSALVVSVWFTWLMSRFMSDKTIWIIPFFITMYVYHADMLPTEWQKAWNFYADYIQNPQNSFPVALMWCSGGVILARPNLLEQISKRTYIFMALFIISYAITVCGFDLRLLIVISLFVLAYQWNIPYRPIYRKMRQSSILIFILHFVFIGIFRVVFPDVAWLQHGPIQFLILVAACLSSSFVILSLKDYKIFRWLRYSY